MLTSCVPILASLKACAVTKDLYKGITLHTDIVKGRLLDKNPYMASALVNMYAKCGELVRAQQLLDDLPVRNTVAWSALIAGYAQWGQGKDALDCFELMLREGLYPDAVTLLCVLKACGSIGADAKGKQIHDEIVSQSFIGKDIKLGAALVDMYVKCGALTTAHQVFNELPARSIVSLSALMTGYAQQGQGEEALSCFDQMQQGTLLPDAFAFATILKACGCVGATDRGREIHQEIVGRGLLSGNVVLGSALLDMYAKCGAIAEAQQVLDELPVRNIVSWSALIAGYAKQGQGKDALNCFEQMQCEGLSPNLITFTSLLNACCRSCLVDEAEICLASMHNIFDIVPGLGHYTCVVDLFGRMGQFEKAITVIGKMPSYDGHVLWSALLSACRKWGKVDLGKWAFKHTVESDEKDAGAYVYMANIFAETNTCKLQYCLQERLENGMFH